MLNILQENIASSDDEEEGVRYKPHKFKVYYESLLIWFDNHESTCKANTGNHFIGQLRPIRNMPFKGYGVLINVGGEGTVKWNIEDDDDKIYYIIIHNFNYIHEPPIFLIYTQKRSKQADDNHPKSGGT